MLIKQKLYTKKFDHKGKFVHGFGVGTYGLDCFFAPHVMIETITIFVVRYRLDTNNENESSLEYEAEVRNVLEPKKGRPEFTFLMGLVDSSMEMIKRDLGLKCNMASSRSPEIEGYNKKMVELLVIEELDKAFPQKPQ